MGATDKLKEQTGLAKKPVTIQQLLEAMKPQIAMALPKHLQPERMLRIALTCMRMNPKLIECDRESILASVMLAAQLGLEPGVMGQCYLVPYKKTCTLVPGWQGILDLVARAGKATAWTGAVYEGDTLDWQLGDQPYLVHKPCGEEDTLTHVYAIARTMTSAWPIIEVWPIHKVWKHRDRHNRIGEAHYSYKFPEMYARKVVLLQALKYVPRSVELAVAYNLEGNAESSHPQSLKIADVKGLIEGIVDREPEPEEQPKQEGQEPSGVPWEAIENAEPGTNG